jgi:hypothetical protein
VRGRTAADKDLAIGYDLDSFVTEQLNHRSEERAPAVPNHPLAVDCGIDSDSIPAGAYIGRETDGVGTRDDKRRASVDLGNHKVDRRTGLRLSRADGVADGSKPRVAWPAVGASKAEIRVVDVNDAVRPAGQEWLA